MMMSWQKEHGKRLRREKQMYLSSPRLMLILQTINDFLSLLFNESHRLNIPSITERNKLLWSTHVNPWTVEGNCSSIQETTCFLFFFVLNTQSKRHGQAKRKKMRPNCDWLIDRIREWKTICSLSDDSVMLLQKESQAVNPYAHQDKRVSSPQRQRLLMWWWWTLFLDQEEPLAFMNEVKGKVVLSGKQQVTPWLSSETQRTTQQSTSPIYQTDWYFLKDFYSLQTKFDRSSRFQLLNV